MPNPLKQNTPDDEFFSYYCHERWFDEGWEEELIPYSDGTFRIDESYDSFERDERFREDYFGGVAYAAMILAMRDLDSEGLFGTASDRDAIVLFCRNSDGCLWLPRESAQRLNAPTIAARFVEEWNLANGLERAEGPHYETFARWIDQYAK